MTPDTNTNLEMNGKPDLFIVVVVDMGELAQMKQAVRVVLGVSVNLMGHLELVLYYHLHYHLGSVKQVTGMSKTEVVV